MKNVAVGILVALVVVIVAFSFSLAAVYRGLALKQGEVEQAWAALSEVYRSQLELLPSLLERAAGVVVSEGEAYEAVKAASRQMADVLSQQVIEEPWRFDRFVASEAALGSSVLRLLAVVEQHSELQGDQNLAALRTQLKSDSDRVTVERSRYNAAASEFNSGLKAFPADWVARFYRFREKEYFRNPAGTGRPAA